MPWKFADPSGPLQLLVIVQLGFWVIYAWVELRKQPVKDGAE